MDSADNEDEIGTKIQVRTHNIQNEYFKEKNNLFFYQNGDVTNTLNANPKPAAKGRNSPGCHINNLCGVTRPNQLHRSKVKHETKL